jgi:hypothetical protein
MRDQISGERKGVRIRLIRNDSPPIVRARLAQLTERVAVIGAPLSPEESPALWSSGQEILSRVGFGRCSQISNFPCQSGEGRGKRCQDCRFWPALHWFRLKRHQTLKLFE